MNNDIGKVGYLGDDENGSLFRITNSDGFKKYFYFQFRYYISDKGSSTNWGSSYYAF